MAIFGAERGFDVSMVESVGKKAGFLAQAISDIGLLNAAVIPQRIESMTLSPPDVITARALAPLPKLLGYVSELADGGTVSILPKGQHVGDELTEATKYWNMTVEQHPSLTSEESTVLVIRNLQRRP